MTSDEHNDAPDNSEIAERLKQIPEAIITPFSMTRVNEPLTLYLGPIQIDFGDGLKIVDAIVTWEWRREPVILCSFGTTTSQQMLNGAYEALCKPYKVVLDDLGVSAWVVHHSHRSSGELAHYQFRFLQPVIVGPAEPLFRAVFHLVNCHDCSESAIRTTVGGFEMSGRLRLDAGPWLVEIDKTPEHSGLVEELNRFGGQAITHVVQVTRKDGTTFDTEMLNEVLNAIRGFLGFAVCSKPHICLGAGFDMQARQIWQYWAACGPSHWLPLINWTYDLPSGHVSRAFPGYFARLQDPFWKEPISIATDWYVQAKHRGLETALVLGQAALELLAASLFEKADTKPCTERDWDSKVWPASARIRWLLQSSGTDVSIPPRLKKLLAFRFNYGKAFDDGPHALTELRNAIAHPKKEKRERFGPTVEELRHEAAIMTLFFLEQTILAITDFDGLAGAVPTHGCLIRHCPLDP